MADKTLAVCREPCPHLPMLLSLAVTPWLLHWIYHGTQHKVSAKVCGASLQAPTAQRGRARPWERRTLPHSYEHSWATTQVSPPSLGAETRPPLLQRGPFCVLLSSTQPKEHFTQLGHLWVGHVTFLSVSLSTSCRHTAGIEEREVHE